LYLWNFAKMLCSQFQHIASAWRLNWDSYMVLSATYGGDQAMDFRIYRLYLQSGAVGSLIDD
jgi:hypothetical protein